MDTVVEYTLLAPDQATALQAVNEAHRVVQHLDSLYWEENPSSPIYQLNHADSSVQLPDSVYHFLKRVQHYWQLSQGFFDPSIKPVLDLYNFEAPHPTPPDSLLVAKTLKYVGLGNFSLEANNRIRKNHPRNALALGGVAKGFIVDQAVSILKQFNIPGGIVNAGGDLKCWRNDEKYWQIGIQHPRKSDVIAILKMKQGAIATSGDYQRFYIANGKRFHHLLNPFSGKPATGSQSATVIAPTCEAADAFATATFVMGPHKGIEWLNNQPHYEGMIIDSLGKLHVSNGFEKWVMEINQ